MSASLNPGSPQHTKARVTTHLQNVFKFALAVALIYWLYRAGVLDPKTFVQLATPGLILFCLACVFALIFINNYRWLKLLQGQGFETTVRRTLPLSLIGMFFNFAMPGGVGGDVVKGYYILQEHPKQKFAAAVSIFMDRIMGFFVMIATAFFALLFNWDIVSKSNELKSVALAVTLLFLGFLVFFFLSLSKLLQQSDLSRLLFEKLPGGGKIRHVYEALHSYRRSPGALAIAVLLSAGTQLVLVGFTYAIGKQMGEDTIPLSAYFFLVPVGTVIQALPISPAGIGVGQAAFYFLFSHYLGRESALGPTSATAMQLLSFAWGLVGAFFYLRRKKPSETPQLG